MIATGTLLRVGAVLAVLAGVGFAGYKYGSDTVRAAWDTERAAAAEATLEREREMRRAVDAVTTAARIEREKANAKNNALRAAIANRDLRLSVAVENCAPAGNTGARDTETRAAILPTVAGRIIDVALDSDDVVRELNECVDKYNAVRDKMNAWRADNLHPP